jgi:hypothetical protein
MGINTSHPIFYFKIQKGFIRMAKQQFDLEVFQAMQGNEPIAVYRKTVLAKVYVQILNAFNQEPEILLLSGPAGAPDSTVNIYSVPEDVFFRRHNRRLFEQGILIPVPVEKKVEVPVEEELPLEQASDETLRQLVNSRYKALEAALTKTESEALVNRILDMARQEEKSEKLIHAIETRLAEIQNARFTQE